MCFFHDLVKKKGEKIAVLNLALSCSSFYPIGYFFSSFKAHFSLVCPFGDLDKNWLSPNYNLPCEKTTYRQYSRSCGYTASHSGLWAAAAQCPISMEKDAMFTLSPAPHCCSPGADVQKPMPVYK